MSRGVPAGRRAELAERLAAVCDRIAVACAAAGRDPGAVALTAVTKTVPAEDVALLLDLGVATLGENRVQEAAAKAARVRELRPDLRPGWHLVGGLQRNKARAVLPWAACVESVDSIRLADALDRAVRRAVDGGAVDEGAVDEERLPGPLPVLVQYSLDGDPGRGGVPDEGMDALVEHVVGLPGLDLRGLMAVAPLDADPDLAFAAVGAAFARLRGVRPEATVLSAGMSADLEVAIRHGSTVVRVGTALVGERRLASP